jgi:hypothetical protein
MANTAQIHLSGLRILVNLDPTSGTWAAPATIDETKISDVVVTASGGPVTIVKVCEEWNEIPAQYPFVNTGSNQVELRFKLSRHIQFGETVTITVPSGLATDGTRVSAASTDLALTGVSYWAEQVGTYINDTTRIVYISDTDGDDTAAAAVNSSQGWYVRTDGVVGSNPDTPAGSVVSYKTIKAALDKIRGTTNANTAVSVNALVLFKRGDTFNISLAANQMNTTGMLITTGGTSATTPLILAGYGSGARCVLDANNTSVRHMSPSAGNTASQNIIVHRGLRFQGSTNHGIRFAAGASGPLVNFAAIGLDTQRILFTNPSSDNRRGVYFAECNFFDPATSGNGGVWATDANWTQFPVRDIVADRCVFARIGGGGNYHGVYIKHFERVVIADSFFYDTSGTPIKNDGCRQFHFYNNICVKTTSITNTETNGEVDAGLMLTRDESSGGSFASKGTVERCIMTNGQDGRSVNGGGGVGLKNSRDVTIRNLLVVNDVGLTTGSCYSFDRDGGSGDAGAIPYQGESFRNRISKCTVVQLAGNAAQNHALSVGLPKNDDFGTAENSRGHHDVIMDQIVAVHDFTPSSVDRLFTATGGEDNSETYADSVTSGRFGPAEFRDICVYSPQGQTDKYGMAPGTSTANTSYSDIDTYKALFGADAIRWRFENPGMVNHTYKISNYLIDDLEYTDLDEAFDDIIDQTLAGTLDPDLTPQGIAAAVLPNYIAAGLDAADYGGAIPGVEDWTVSSGPLTITNSDGTTISQPVSATAQPNTDVRFVVRLNAVGQNLTGLTYTESGVLRLETGILPLTLADGTSSTFAVLLRSPTLGANQAGSITITANGGLSATVDYLLTVASPWSIRRSDGSAIPANPITGTFQQAAGGAVFQVRIDANADTLENFSYTTDGIVTLPTGPVELGPLSPGESKILNIFLDTATLGAGQTGYAEIDFDANGVAVTTIRMEFDIEVIEAVLEASRARSRSRIR